MRSLLQCRVVSTAKFNIPQARRAANPIDLGKMRGFLGNMKGAIARVFPSVGMQAQAVAFNMFFAFFPFLLVAVGILSASARLTAGVEEMLGRLRAFLPPGSQRMVADYLLELGGRPITWVTLGITGTILGGTQAMAGLIQGFRTVYRDLENPGFWRDQFRAFLVLFLTSVPWLVAVILTVFGRQLRMWTASRFGAHPVLEWFWAGLYTTIALLLAIITLALVYRIGRPRCRSWNEVWPGTVVATFLWWAVNSIFGYYVRHMPYDRIYGGLAAAIGLLLWMYLSAMVVYIGAAFNAEVCARALRRAAVKPPVAPAQ